MRYWEAAMMSIIMCTASAFAGYRAGRYSKTKADPGCYVWQAEGTATVYGPVYSDSMLTDGQVRAVMDCARRVMDGAP